MNGVYRFYDNGQLVCVKHNIITDRGKQAILKYLAGLTPSYAGAIAVGVDQTAAASSDLSLGLEVSKVPILVRSVDYTYSDIIFKGSLDIAFTGRIYEVGLISQYENSLSGQYSNKIITAFEPIENWTGTAFVDDTTNTRVGSRAIKSTIASNNGTATQSANINVDLGGYSSTDQIAIGYISSSTVASITLKFTNMDQVEMSYTQSVTHNASQPYNIYKINKSSFSNAGSDWSNIYKVTVTTTGSGTAGTTPAEGSWDVISVLDSDGLNPEYNIVSRTSSESNIPLATKAIARTMDIEYRLGFTL